VLQRQFWDLVADDEAFSVSLSFNASRHRITVPYGAIESFADPGAAFSLRFDLPTSEEETPEDTAASAPGEKPEKEAFAREHRGPTALPESREEATEGREGQVVKLDDFRRR